MEKENLLWIIPIALFLSLIFYNLAQPKTFEGYYLHVREGRYLVYINWEHRVDERIFQSYDHNTTLAVYDSLTAGGNGVEDLAR